jgi:hypothetical protein
MLPRTTSIWQRNSLPKASGKPGAVQRDRLLPADTMPLSARSKLLMMVEAGASLLTVGLAAALAVNVLV